MSQSWTSRIVFLCFVLCVLRYTSVLNNIHQAIISTPYLITVGKTFSSDDSVNLGFSLFEFEQAKLEETKLEQEYDLTAVLLHWKRLEGVQKTLKLFLKTELFKEIIVWNNNPQIKLTMDHLINTNESRKLIRIINSKENLKDAAKYRGCTEAVTRGCFYADDDWNVGHYIKSLIASFRSDPNLLHSVTDEYTFYTNLIWSYFDTTIDLHTGFSWIGCGSVFLREHAQRHLQFLNKFLVNDSGMKIRNISKIDHIPFSALIHLSDLFFSIWLNDIPSQMNTNIRSQSSSSLRGSLPFSSTARFSELQYLSSVSAIRILERSLRFNRSNNNEVQFPRQQNRRFPYLVKSPSFNDDFIFYTNVIPVDMQNISFYIYRDFERGTRRNLPHGPNVSYFTSHSTSKAVDGDRSTCWHTTRNIQAGDFFAIDFLRAQTNISFKLIVSHNRVLQHNLDISISFDGIWWLSYRSFKGIFIKKNHTAQEEQLYTNLFDSTQFARGFESFRYIAFKTMNNSNQRFQVCEIEVVSKKNIHHILHDFYPLNT